MTKISKNKSAKSKKINPRLAAMFKMTREELAHRKTSGGGIHHSKLHDVPRSVQKRSAIDEQTD